MKTYTTDGRKVTDLQEEILAALAKVRDMVCSTMGPGGRNVTIHSDSGIATTKDGVTVARYLNFGEPVENLVALMAVDAASKTVKEVGDGTTTSVLMVEAIYRHLRILMNGDSGLNLFGIASGIDAAVEIVKNNLLRMAIAIQGEEGIHYERLRDVAIISANNDEVLGRMIAKLIFDIGENGFVEVRHSLTEETYTEKTDGYVFNTVALKDFIPSGSSFVELVNPVVFMADLTVSDYDDIQGMIQVWEQNCSREGVLRPLLMIVSDIEGSALSTMVLNSRKMPIMVVKAPMFGAHRSDLMGDIQKVTGTRNVFSNISGMPLSMFGDEIEGDEELEFGSASKVRVYKDKVVIVRSKDRDKVIGELIEGLQNVIKESKSEGEVYWMKERISRLSSGVGVIYVGANSELELGFKKMVIDDAQRACFTALDGGIVIGGGNALAKCREVLLEGMTVNDIDITHEELLGMDAIAQALTEPMEKIMRNLFIGEGKIEEVCETLFDEDKLIELGLGYNVGYNPTSDKYEDLYNAGIVDPVKVTVSALKNAASIVKQLLTTEYFLFLESKEDMDLGKLFYPDR